MADEYEARHAAELAHRVQLFQEREQAVEDVAAELSAAVVKAPDVEARQHASSGHWVLEVTHNGQPVRFGIGYSTHRGYDKRWTVSAYYPRDSEGRYTLPRDVGAIPYGHTLPAEIGVAFTKRPKIIAREIEARFLPDYVPVYRATVDALAKREGAADRRKKMAQAFAAQIGGDLHGRDPSSPVVRLYRPQVSADVSSFDEAGQTVKLDISGVPVALAVELLQKLAGVTQ